MVLGVMVGWKIPYNPWILWSLALVFWAASVYSYKQKKAVVTHSLIIVLVVLLTALRCQMTSPMLRPDSLAHLVDKGRTTVELLVVTPVKRDRNTFSFEAEVLSCYFRGKRYKNLQGRLYVILEGIPNKKVPTYGTRLKTNILMASLPDRFLSPWSNGRDHEHARSIVGRTRISAFSVKVLSSRPPSRLRASLYRFRKRLTKLIDQTHEHKTGSVIKALLLGDKSSLSPAFWREFRRAGTVHLLAQSGLHVGILALVVYITAGAFRLGRKNATVVTLIVLGLFCVMVGEQPAVLRASLMTAFILIGRLLDLNTSYFTSLSAAAIVLLIYSPASLALPGFQLSFIATLGILYLSPVFADFLCFLPTGLAGLASVSLAAFLSTAPLLLYHFDGIPLAAPLANMLVLPLVGVILPCALLTLVGGLFNAWLAFFFGAANYGLISLLVMANSLFASKLFPLIRVETLPYPLILLWYLILVLIGDERVQKSISQQRAVPNTDVATELLEGEQAGPDEELFRDISLLENSGELLSEVISAHRSLITKALPALRLQAPEASQRLRERLGNNWCHLSPEATELLLFAECWHLSTKGDEYRPAMAALLKAIEHELTVKLFEAVRDFVKCFPTPPRGQELTALAEDKKLTLPLQLDLLWLLATPGGPRLEPLVLSLRGMLDRCLSNSSVVLDASRLPLLVDQLMRRYYWKLPLPEHVTLATLLAARETIIGGGEEGLLGQILSCRELSGQN